MGLGKTGQSAARFLLRQGHICEGFDEQKVELPDDLAMPVHIDLFDTELLRQFDRIVISPGIRWSGPVLDALRQNGARIVSDLDIFLEHYDGPVVAVTGTNGKTTTTFLIETMLETLPGGIEAGGNIGVPMLDLLKDGRQPARVTLELSSFQLERSVSIRPAWAVLLNFQEDHADMHGNQQEYLAAKLKLFEQQQEGDTTLLPNDPEWSTLASELSERGVHVHRFGRCDENDPAPDGLAAGIMETSNGPVLFWHQHERRHFLPCEQIPARGKHQYMNMAVAAQAAADFGVNPEVIRETMTSFRGLKHRLEHVDMRAGRDWYDDSKATNPQAAVAALDSFNKVIWICGGLRKGLDLKPLIPAIREHVSQAFVIGKESSAYTDILKEAGVSYQVAGKVERAVSQAAKCDGSDPVLLSPAAASQDQFANYSERGKAFAKAVMALGGGAS